MPTLEITTKLGCALACTFCPQGPLVKGYPKSAPKLLSLANFIAALNKVPLHVRIDFSGMAEPWLNPEATAMVDFAYSKGHEVSVYTTLQGLNARDAEYLLNNYSHRITPRAPWVIHLPDNQNNMPGWKVSDSYKETLMYLLKFKSEHPDLPIRFMTMSSEGRVHPDIADIFDPALEKFIGISRAENLKRSDFDEAELISKINLEDPVLCGATPFYDHNGMLPNGDVVLCCMDYGLKNIIGNLFDQSYDDLFGGQKLAEIRRLAMKPGRDESFICKQCIVAVCYKTASPNDNVWIAQSAAAFDYKPPAISIQAQVDYQCNEAHGNIETIEKNSIGTTEIECGMPILERKATQREKTFTPKDFIGRAFKSLISGQPQ